MESNLVRNTEHFDAVYARSSPAEIASSVADPEGFVEQRHAYSVQYRALYSQGWPHRLAGKRVLEIGFGYGLNVLVMAQLGASEVVATEISPIACRHLEEAATLLGVRGRINTRVSSGPEDYTGLGRFDVVVGAALLHHMTVGEETAYLRVIAGLLEPYGEARFTEPAVNSKILDSLRWIIPVRGRPSALQRSAFRRWQEQDPHPHRPTSHQHFRRALSRHFRQVRITPFGCVERFSRFGSTDHHQTKRFSAFALDLEERMLPMSLRAWAARSQLIEAWEPRQSRLQQGAQP